MSIRRFEFPYPKVTAQIVDETNGFNWICFAQNNDGVCRIQKVSANNLFQIYFDIEKEIDSIPCSTINTTSLFLGYEDDELFGELFSLTNPLTSSTEIEIPDGILEAPVNVKVSGSSLYFLTPGVLSGTVANIIRYNTSGVFQEVIELSKSGAEVTNASAFTIDASGDLWVVTNNSPAEYVRVFDTGGFNWDFTIYDAI